MITQFPASFNSKYTPFPPRKIGYRVKNWFNKFNKMHVHSDRWIHRLFFTAAEYFKRIQAALKTIGDISHLWERKNRFSNGTKEL